MLKYRKVPGMNAGFQVNIQQWPKWNQENKLRVLHIQRRFSADRTKGVENLKNKRQNATNCYFDTEHTFKHIVMENLLVAPVEWNFFTFFFSFSSKNESSLCSFMKSIPFFPLVYFIPFTFEVNMKLEIIACYRITIERIREEADHLLFVFQSRMELGSISSRNASDEDLNQMWDSGERENNERMEQKGNEIDTKSTI